MTNNDKIKELLSQINILLEEKEPMPAKLTLEVGKQYVRRDGEITGELDDSSSGVFIDHKYNKSYYCDGRYSIRGWYPEDLVALYEEPKSAVPELTLAEAAGNLADIIMFQIAAGGKDFIIMHEAVEQFAEAILKEGNK